MMQEYVNFLSQHATLTIPLIAIFILVVIVEFIRATRASRSLAPQQATSLINHDNAVVIDIRNKEAYQKGHIINAQHFTPEEVRSLPKKLEKFRTKPLIIVCNNGQESQKIVSFLSTNGFNAYALAGGLRGWMDTQMPLIKE